MKKWLLLALLCATPASAQITVPNTFTANTIIKSSEVNANFSALAVNALNRTGGIMSGTLTTLSVVPFAGSTYDLGSSGTKFRSAYFSGTVTTADLTLASPATGITVAGNVIVNSTGKIPALTTTYFASLSGASLTNLAAANLTGTTLPSSIVSSSLTSVGVVTSGTWSGTLGAVSGAALTSLTAANISAGTAGINITGTAPAGTLTGTTLASNVVTSSLTSVGTISSGTWSGSFGTVSGANLTSLNATNISAGTLSQLRLGNIFGAWAVGTQSTDNTAATDLIVIVVCPDSGSANLESPLATFIAYCGPSFTPGVNTSFSSPVRKGDHYRVNVGGGGGITMRVLPIGS